MVDLKIKKKKFEDLLSRLNEIVNTLEQGDLGLEKSLDIFEEGIKLVKAADNKLNDAEKRISILLSSKDGEITTKPFDTDN